MLGIRFIPVMCLRGIEAVKNFCDYAYYYNAFYGDKDYSGEAKKVDKNSKGFWLYICPPSGNMCVKYWLRNG